VTSIFPPNATTASASSKGLLVHDPALTSSPSLAEMGDTNGRNFPRYTTFANGGGNGGGAASGGNGGNHGNGAKRKQRGGRPKNNNSVGFNRGVGDAAPRFSPHRNPQKFKSFTDKRPRTRNTNNENSDHEIAPGTRSAFGYSLDASDSHESFGAQRGRAGKKSSYNMNHLLNFRYEEPASRGRNCLGSGHLPIRGRKTSTGSSCHVAFNKDHFLLATCQFVLNDNVDFKPYIDNPDLLVDWSVVEQVRIRNAGEALVCPICLEIPVAPQVTKCGHVYCFGCMLHHAASSDKKWSSCPICFEMVYPEDLRSASVVTTTNFAVGDVLTLSLMLVLANGKSTHPHTLADSDSDVFGKISTMSQEEILLEIIEPELAAIQSAMAAADKVEILFLEQARDAVKLRKEKLLQGEWERGIKDFLQAFDGGFEVDDILDSPLGGNVEDTLQYDDWFDMEANEKAVRSREEAKLEDDAAESIPAEAAADDDALEAEAIDQQVGQSGDCVPEVAVNIKAGLSTAGEFFFYQSADGQKIFLHSINAKCIAFEYGALNSAPQTISARILQIDEGSVTESLRKRCKYLSTLPINCPFKVVELDLKSPLVSEEALDNFTAELHQRRQIRQSKERYEKRIHRKQQKKEKRLHSTTVIVPSASVGQRTAERRPDPDVDSPDTGDVTTFPEFNVSVLKPSHSVTTVEEKVEGEVSSFAAMLKGGKQPGLVKAWPTLGPALAPSPGKIDAEKTLKTKPVDGDEDEGSFVPAFKESFSDALSKVFDGLQVQDKDSKLTSIVEDECPVEVDMGKKKKKSKPKLLFSTSMQPRKQ